MKFPRASGILLHPTSLPGPGGIGEFGDEAYRFVDWLAGGGQSLWQVLPLGPTGYGDSPYQCFSAFAGNPLLISLAKLVDEKLLDQGDLDRAPSFPLDHVDYGRVLAYKLPLLRKAARRHHGDAAFERFCGEQAWWLDDFAQFMALKLANGGVAWTEWRQTSADPHEIRAQKFAQFKFFEQWDSLRAHCRRRGVRVMGDIPIYVAHDGCDVWAHREFFQLRENGEPAVVAGVPPDYFSATGQLWGNPIYRWDVIASGGYQWWIERLRAALRQVDMVRLDHFRGFEAYWEVPGGAPTAANGRWVKGPGTDLLRALTSALGPLPLVAENLGVITPEVEAMRNEFGFPGMAVLQFAFGTDPQAPTFLPHNYQREIVAYTGTHDNDTTAGWWNSAGGESTRTPDEIEMERERARRYLHSDGREMHWAFIRALMASVADTVLFPLQDVLGLGNDARMNMPSRPAGNWRWRCLPGAPTTELQDRLRELSVTYERI